MTDRDGNRFARRRLLGVLGTGATVGLAGCIGDLTEGGNEDGDGGDEAADDGGNGDGDAEDELGDEDRRALAEEMVDAIDDELSVSDWELPGMFVPEYTDSGGVEEDVPILGDAYADIVEQGFDRRAMPTAVDDDGDTEFMVNIRVEWAEAYLDGDWSEAEYYAEIEDSEH